MVAQSVSLADKSRIPTKGKVDLKVSFGPYTYFGTFYVLQANIPLILGMTFLKNAQPKVDWLRRQCFIVKGKQRCSLPVLPYDSRSMHVLVNSWPGETQRDNTSSKECISKYNKCIKQNALIGNKDKFLQTGNRYSVLQVVNVDDNVIKGRTLPDSCVSDLVVAPKNQQNVDDVDADV